MARLLSIAADLSAPPSSPTSFREVTLYSSSLGYQNVALAPADMIDPYAVWFRRYGLFDYLDDLLPDTIVLDASVSIEGGCAARLTAFNLQEVLLHIPH